MKPFFLAGPAKILKGDAGREVLRHDTAHLMAEAVKELYPDTQVTIGTAIENGFYYDFQVSDVVKLLKIFVAWY